MLCMRDCLAAFDFWGLDVYIKPVHGLFQGYLYSFDRMFFQQTGKQDNAGRFERGYLKVTTENLTNWDLPGCEKPPKTNE